MQQPAQNIQLKETRAILLQAAGEVFGEAGFKAATVRAICERARVNVALVKYYFGDKERLYAEVVRYSAYYTGAEDFPPDVATPGLLEPEQRLQKYIECFMERMLDRGRPAWHRKLMARELADPSGLLDRLARDTFAPHFRLLTSIVSECLGGNAPRQHVELCAVSVLGQILFYQHARSYIVRVAPDVKYTPRQVSEWSEHIFKFSCAALAGLSANPPLRTATHKEGKKS